MELRYLTSGDREQAIFLWDTCFGDGEEYINWAFDHYFALEDAIGIFEREQLLSAVYTRRCTISFKGTEYCVPMIAGVATLPAARAHGYSTQILKMLLKERENAGDALAVLNTYIPDFYRRLGFRNIAPMACYRVKPEEGIAGAEEQTQADLSFLRECYREYCAGFDGFIARNEGDFSLRIQDALKFGGKLIVSGHGYLILDPKTGTAIETVCTRKDDLLALAGKAAQLAGKEILIKAPPVLKWECFLGEPQKVETGAMIYCFRENGKNFFGIGTNPDDSRTWCILEEY